MKYIFMAVLNMMLFSGVCWAGEKLDMSDEKIRVNYSVGYQVGGDFKRQGLEINPEQLVRGVQDALSGAKPLMSQEEMRGTLVELQKTTVAARERKKKAQAERNLLEGRAFLVSNAKNEGVFTLPSGLQYKVIEEGKGESPKPGETVTVHYKGTLIDGSEFDSSYRRGEPATFRSDRVIKGWQEALGLMKPGSKWQLFVPSELAYGDKSPGRLVGANSTLIFEVELLSVK